jgi:hypothetical protein
MVLAVFPATQVLRIGKVRGPSLNPGHLPVAFVPSQSERLAPKHFASIFDIKSALRVVANITDKKRCQFVVTSIESVHQVVTLFLSLSLKKQAIHIEVTEPFWTNVSARLSHLVNALPFNFGRNHLVPHIMQYNSIRLFCG